jgi:hypothetical protein
MQSPRPGHALAAKNIHDVRNCRVVGGIDCRQRARSMEPGRRLHCGSKGKRLTLQRETMLLLPRDNDGDRMPLPLSRCSPIISRFDF